MEKEELELIKELIKQEILDNLTLEYESYRDWDSTSINRTIKLKYKDETISSVDWYAKNS